MDHDPKDALEALGELHAAIDAEAAQLAAGHGERLVCKAGCCQCCVDELTVFEVEAERIRRASPDVLASAPHPTGACAFLDDAGHCRVYNDRPYVCRTQGLPLLWFEEDSEEEIHELRDICELNVEGQPLAELEYDEMWTIGPRELDLQRLQGRFSGGGQERVALRELFETRA